MDVKKKYEIEAALATEAQAISAGQLKEENPLDVSEDFSLFCEACRRGDLKVCQEMISTGVNINARDKFDYTPLILASLCGHYEVIRLLLENGALCERDTFQGERCLYNALNDRIRNLLLSYDYAKSSNPLQPLAAHITSLLTRTEPKTTDITIEAYGQEFHLHKFLLAARSPYFAKKLDAAPNTTVWKLPDTIPAESLGVALQYLYFQEVSIRRALFGLSDEHELVVLNGIDKIGKQLEMERLFEDITEVSDRRLLRQRRADELERGRDQLESWFKNNVLRHKRVVDTAKVDNIQWDRQNSIFADILLRADDDEDHQGPNDTDRSPAPAEKSTPPVRNAPGPLLGIPVGAGRTRSRSPSRQRTPRKSTIFPAHRAMLLRSEYFLTMFSSQFKEAQDTPHLQIVTIDCSPAVLETILTFMYTERADFGLDIAIDVLFAADQLFIEKLKQRAAIIISALGNGATSAVESDNPRGATDADEPVDIYEVIRAGWDTRVQRLEEFAARYIAYRLENYIDQPEFAELVQESANRVKARQETDTVELVDDIRYYLSERFRLRFEDSGLDEMMDENAAIKATAEEDLAEAMGDVALEDGRPEKPTQEENFIPIEQHIAAGVIRNLDGEEVGDEFAQDAMNYQILLGKIDTLLERLNLDA
ncbi:ankyrin repeat and BTB POZ domain-containing protein 1 [Pyrenophora tritici-repentis]|uniref:Ankyrin repeat and BTB-POZ domain-containing protein 1 n=2 Tax=Pyrenophora tritici-repentis TaxID=45151 RepID=A0A2W1FHJ2_9PLEO|nr:ankyrin repeat and BTB/POZ domain-containing protein 1 [Pyrenophora tritici-repentis Pt-1C-BFP]KAA8618437.1 Ankyrin repeat and BTB/POZ domain-containing protein 1 [Pyrenophora tritici-repentis]EDU48295.1 ankyrin repeat and BTB/POZ domain-containing protein 1 [Pyrenophora tritici-repentis Pt-1C-BFP]KAF7448909.1 Ankyrin repeat and BTB/POZ domain-containing protein [Pyrenophora tritici-repentis]KAF7571095.1 ankyrin repeat and BTB-POZ domain-containing protein 1 [Pyrenophora tritici-repentis]KA